MKRWTLADMPSLKGKTAIVTGANSGLGLETSAGLAAAGATVIMACRNPDKAKPAVEAVRARAPGATVEAMPLDLATLGSVRRFAQDAAAALPRLDILVNNAGVMALPFGKTADGFEMQLGTNHFGHFALTGLLLPQLRAAGGARVVTVASIAHKTSPKLDVDDLLWQKRSYSAFEAYAHSKFANLVFNYELARRLDAAGAGMIAAAAHPGYAATSITSGNAGENPFKRLAYWLGNLLFAQSAAAGALPSLYAAASPEAKNGGYYGPHGFMQFRGYPVRVQSRADAADPDLGARFWAVSERSTGVSYLS